MYSIGIVEDDDTLAELIQDQLRTYQYNAFRFTAPDRIGEEIEERGIHLLLLDINLPGKDGFHLCQEIREKSKVPILFISARSGNLDQILALNAGGDDYLVKPFSLDLLLAKIEAILRRTYSYEQEDNHLHDSIEYKGVRLHLSSFTLEYEGGRNELTKHQFRILHLFFRNPGAIVSREELMDQLWQKNTFVDDNIPLR